MGGFPALQIQLLTSLTMLLLTVTSTTSLNYPVAKPGCLDRCGDITIPYPFGTTPGCYHSDSFIVDCNRTFGPHKMPFLQNTSNEITEISLAGQLVLLQYVADDQTETLYAGPWIELPTQLTVNNTGNEFNTVGCDTYGYISGSRHLDRNYTMGCTAMWSYDNYSYVWGFNNCSYAGLADERAFPSFSHKDMMSLRGVQTMSMVVDWAMGNGTCDEARRNITGYACKSRDSECYEPSNGSGYRCSCREGYEGNPYLVDGCRDVNECLNPTLNVCEKRCINTVGGFHCVCPKGYYGGGRKGGKGCISDGSLVYKLAAGIAIGVIGLLLAGCWLHWELKRRRLIKTRRKFFMQNGGMLLQEKLVAKKRSASACTTRIFSSSELKKATKNLNSSMIIGQGGYGTVYKGLLQDNRTVAIKKSKLEVDPNQIEQFINEVIILTQINHRNVVKLLGCCLETRVPLLVYEFVSNGTLYEHLHDGKDKARALSWDVRLTIARETAGVLSYLHSSASILIIHRDVKSANILLDHTFTAKVSDFGASKLVPLDHTQLSTVVQGTLGYLDPEYVNKKKNNAHFLETNTH